MLHVSPYALCRMSGHTTGWTRIRHPDFGSYLFHEEMRVCTNTNHEMSFLHSVVTQLLRDLKESAPPDAGFEMTVVLDSSSSSVGADQRPTFGYYFASHTHKRVFWLEDFNLACLSEQCDGSTESSSRCKLKKHCELFPNTLNVSEAIIRELKSILVHASADRVTSKFSTSPYAVENLLTMLELVNNIEPQGKSKDGCSAWTIGISYGQNDDYFDIEYSEPDSEPYRRSILMAAFSAEVYAEELHSLRDNFSLARWKTFVHKVDISIRDSNLLQLEAVDSSSANSSRSGAQIVVYCSVICSIGSIIIGLVIFKQYRAKGADTPARAIIILKRIFRKQYGLERNCCYLQPAVHLTDVEVNFLILFSIAFCENAFSRTDVQTRTPVAVAISLVFSFVFGSLYTAGPRDKEEKVGRQITGFVPATCKQLRKPDDPVQCADIQGDMETGLKTC
ncbi:hypothetical protein EDD22DRAFT_886664 [Suillus occidentalis]|nr:hypothetical protein EDD22DRAFT_886664 [Suillus occidentalis]